MIIYTALVFLSKSTLRSSCRWRRWESGKRAEFFYVASRIGKCPSRAGGRCRKFAIRIRERIRPVQFRKRRLPIDPRIYLRFPWRLTAERRCGQAAHIKRKQETHPASRNRETVNKSRRNITWEKYRREISLDTRGEHFEYEVHYVSCRFLVRFKGAVLLGRPKITWSLGMNWKKSITQKYYK